MRPGGGHSAEGQRIARVQGAGGLCPTKQPVPRQWAQPAASCTEAEGVSVKLCLIVRLSVCLSPADSPLPVAFLLLLAVRS